MKEMPQLYHSRLAYVQPSLEAFISTQVITRANFKKRKCTSDSSRQACQNSGLYSLSQKLNLVGAPKTRKLAFLPP